MEETTHQEQYDELWNKILEDDNFAGAISHVCKNDFFSYIATLYYLINCGKFMLKDFHMTIIKKLQDIADGKNNKRNLALCLPVGCVSGDTILNLNRSKIGRKHTIKSAYENYHHIGKNKRYYWNNDITTYIRQKQNDKIHLGTVEDIVYSGEKETYTLTLSDGKQLRATANHLILTKNGYIPLIKLKQNDLVAVDNMQKIGFKEHKVKPRDKYVGVGKYHPYASYVGKYTYRIEIHRAIYEAYLNGMKLREYRDACYRGEKLKFVNTKTHCIHHIDGNHFNNDISNLQLLTKEEHYKLHGNSNHFGQGNIDYAKVISVEKYGIEPVYDVTCKIVNNEEPNFVANGIVIHNSGKSLITEYFLSWCFARSRDNAFVYTSHSEDLITKMSAEIRSICTSPAWVRLFGWKLRRDDRQKTNFSFEGAKNRTGLRAKAINSAITGLDAGNPAVDGFSGALLIDDPMDAGNAIYEIERENVIRIYNEKLSTRRRTPNTPTILIMQRLHPDDLVGWIEKNQPDLWDIVKVQALNENDESFWEERYPAEELKILRDRQTALFQAQYQQEPIVTGGTLIHTSWFKYYDVHPKYERIFIVADTAQKANEWNDFSVFQVWGKYQNGLYLIDMIHEKLEVPDLLKKARSLTQKYKLWENRLMLSAVYIEDKGSGIGLIQQLRQECPIPVLPLTPKKKDKVTRVKDILYYIESGMIHLPNDKDWGFNPTFLNECEMFSADGKAKHDDQCFEGNTLVSTIRGDIPIKDIKKGDYVITPFGLKKVLNCGITGYKKTIRKFGLNVTPNHKIFANGKFNKIDNLDYDASLDRLTYEGLLKWKYKKLLSLMASNIDLWGRKSIILANQQQIKEEKILKDFMLRFGNFIVEKQYQKVMLFIIKMVTLLITNILTWNVYQGVNIIKNILNIVQNLKQNTLEKNIAANNVIPVYNITVDEVGCFYANGILVSNCDCLTYAINVGLVGVGSSIFD